MNIFNGQNIEKTPHNTGFAPGVVSCELGALCFYSSSVQVDSFVLRNPPERKARKRYKPFLEKQQDNIFINLLTL